MLALLPKKGHRIDSSLVRSFRTLATRGMVSPGARPGHNDGWGIVSWADCIPEYLGREPSNAALDQRFEEACKKIDSMDIRSAMIAHLRKSAGLKTVGNTHPFVKDNWAFAHNGTIRKLNLKMRTDSEWFFESLMHRFDGLRDMRRAIVEQVSSVQEIYPYTSITFVLSNGSELYAYRDSTKNQLYYSMQYTWTGDCLVISQEQLFESDWVEVRNGELLHADLEGGLETEVLGRIS